jgi:Holliday junction resolvase RusA-like endonuclease
MIDIFIAGLPKPLPRPRFRIVPAKDDRPSFVMTYMADGAWKVWKEHVAAELRKALQLVPGKLLLQPDDCVVAELDFVMKLTDAAVSELHHGIMPDLDNLVKLVMDAATEAKVYYDDSRVSEIRARKRYPQGKESPGVRVRLRKAPGQNELPLVGGEDAPADQAAERLMEGH